MFKAFYSGKQSSLTLFRHVPRKLKNLGPQSTTLPSLYGIPESTAVETDYVFEKHPSPNKKSPSKLHGFPQYSQSPISDLSFQTASLLRLDSFRDLKPIMINDLPELPLVDSPSFPAIFDDKIEACTKICPFADEKAERLSIDRKTTHLTEIHKLFLGSSPQSSRLTDDQFQKIYEMCMHNIVRRLPNLGPLEFVNEDVAPLQEPAWPHLSIVYSILIKVLMEYPEAPFFTLKTATRLLRATSSGDSRERAQLSTFLAKFLLLRQEFLYQMIDKFSTLVEAYAEGLYSPFAITTILNAYLEIVNDASDVSPQFTKFFRSSIIPLLSDKYFSFFEQTLVRLIDFFIEDDQRNAHYVVQMILKKWPYTSLNKQTTFLNILMRCLPKMTSRELHPIIPKVLSLLANSSDSECMKVAETAFSMWTTIGFEKIINDNFKLILKVFTPHIINARHNHWSPVVRSNANFAISVLMKRDPKFMQNFSQNQQSFDPGNEELKNWVIIARTASRCDDSLNLSKKLNEISSTYSAHFMARPRAQSMNVDITRARSQSVRPQQIIKPMLSSNLSFA